jgi:hypothetical protein
MSEGILGGNVRAIGILSVTIDPASVATITTAEQTFTVPGLALGDFVVASKPTNTAGLGVSSCRVSAANTLAIQFVNPTAGSVDAASEVWNVLWVRASGVLPGSAQG